MTANKDLATVKTEGEIQSNCGPDTKIMDKYTDLNPKYKSIYEVQRYEKRVLKIELSDKRELVLKHLKFESDRKDKVRELYNEYLVGKTLASATDNVVKPLDIKEITVNDNIIIEILMEYGGISLSKVMKKHELKDGDAINIGIQLLNVFALMERINISHLDVKPLNIVWDGCRIRLIDFGTSLMFYGKTNMIMESMSQSKLLGFTRCYAAPEIEDESKAAEFIPQKVDVFSFGATFLELMASEYKIKLPTTYNKNGYIQTINIEQLKIKTKLNDLLDLIIKCISHNPQERPTFNQLRNELLNKLRSTKYSEIIEQASSMDDALNAILYLENNGKSINASNNDSKEQYNNMNAKLDKNSKK